MARIAAITTLANGVRQFFTDNGITTNVSVGWKGPTKRTNEGPGGANRVVFIPSDPSGRGGRMTISGHTRTTHRVIATWEQNIVVAVWAVDASSQTALADDEKQVSAVNDLLEKTMEAIQHVAHAAAVPGEINWVLEPLEHAFGREVRIAYVLRSEICGRDITTRTPGPNVPKPAGFEEAP